MSTLNLKKGNSSLGQARRVFLPKRIINYNSCPTCEAQRPHANYVWEKGCRPVCYDPIEQYKTEEKPTKKYRLLKPISLTLLRNEGSIENSDYSKALTFFKDLKFDASDPAPQELIEYCKRASCRIPVLIKLGYLEEIKPKPEEIFFHVGQRFISKCGDEYVLSWVSATTCKLIDIKNGSYYACGGSAVDGRKITEAELEDICNQNVNTFTPIPGT